MYNTDSCKCNKKKSLKVKGHRICSPKSVKLGLPVGIEGPDSACGKKDNFINISFSSMYLGKTIVNCYYLKQNNRGRCAAARSLPHQHQLSIEEEHELHAHTFCTCARQTACFHVHILHRPYFHLSSSYRSNRWPRERSDLKEKYFSIIFIENSWNSYGKILWK